MKPVLSAGLVCALLAGSTVLAGDDIPTFKKRGDMEKKFVASVGAAIVKAARTKPQKIDMESYEYKHNTPRAGRTELNIKMIYHGLATKKKYTADIKVLLDTSDKERWEVLNIKYTDTNPSLLSPSEKKIQELVKTLNR
jgi:hypothetical protein